MSMKWHCGKEQGGGEDVKTNSHPGNVFELGEQARGGGR